MSKTIMVTGIHGVGKDFILNQIIDKLNLKYYNASSLIKLEIGESDNNKQVKDIDYNQKILIQSIKKNVFEDTFILNGHLCIIDDKKNIQKIKKEILAEFNLVGIVLIIDDVKTIIKRIYERDKKNLSELFLNELQLLEKEYAKEISNEFNIPLFVHRNGNDLEEIIEVINGFER